MASDAELHVGQGGDGLGAGVAERGHLGQRAGAGQARDGVQVDRDGAQRAATVVDAEDGTLAMNERNTNRLLVVPCKASPYMEVARGQEAETRPGRGRQSNRTVRLRL